jgi:uncharacterized membrane protein
MAKPTGEILRLEAFSDGVFALSATLLVVSLEVPKTVPELIAEIPGFAAFALSFAALVLIWSVHNAFFRRYPLQDPWTIVLNSCLLFVVLFYVYPLKFLAKGFARSVFGISEAGASGHLIRNAGELSALFVLYGIGFSVVFLCVALLYRHAYRQRADLELTAAEGQEALLYFRHYLIFVFVGLLSVLVAWRGIGLRIGFPGWIYALIGPLCYAHGTWSHRRQPAVELGAEGSGRSI